MASARTKRSEQLWEQYRAMQLTPEEKAEARAELDQQVERARRAGAYHRVIEMIGTVKWSVSWEELRKED